MAAEAQSVATAAHRWAQLWPASALACWLLGGLGFKAMALAGMHAPWPALLSVALVLGLALLHQRPWRRWIVAVGWPLALVAQATPLPAWAWAALALVLLTLYPRAQWRDAPLYPTPLGALDALAQAAPLPPGARVLDGGCGKGDGLLALARTYPHAQLIGIEMSWPLVLWSRWRCRQAKIQRADFWQAPWGDYALVYLFQRPESMPQALAKARSELRPGTWLVSLDFPLPGVAATKQWPFGRHTVFLYPFESLN